MAGSNPQPPFPSPHQADVSAGAANANGNTSSGNHPSLVQPANSQSKGHLPNIPPSAPRLPVGQTPVSRQQPFPETSGGGSNPQQMMLNFYIYDYCKKRNFLQSASTFSVEAQVPADTGVPIDAPEGFLYEWWSVFWDIFSAKAHKTGSREAISYVDAQAIKAQRERDTRRHLGVPSLEIPQLSSTDLPCNASTNSYVSPPAPSMSMPSDYPQLPLVPHHHIPQQHRNVGDPGTNVSGQSSSNVAGHDDLEQDHHAIDSKNMQAHRYTSHGHQQPLSHTSFLQRPAPAPAPHNQPPPMRIQTPSQQPPQEGHPPPSAPLPRQISQSGNLSNQPNGSNITAFQIQNSMQALGLAGRDPATLSAQERQMVMAYVSKAQTNVTPNRTRTWSDGYSFMSDGHDQQAPAAIVNPQHIMGQNSNRVGCSPLSEQSPVMAHQPGNVMQQGIDLVQQHLHYSQQAAVKTGTAEQAFNNQPSPPALKRQRNNSMGGFTNSQSQQQGQQQPQLSSAAGPCGSQVIQHSSQNVITPTSSPMLPNKVHNVSMMQPNASFPWPPSITPQQQLQMFRNQQFLRQRNAQAPHNNVGVSSKSSNTNRDNSNQSNTAANDANTNTPHQTVGTLTSQPNNGVNLGSWTGSPNYIPNPIPPTTHQLGAYRDGIAFQEKPVQTRQLQALGRVSATSPTNSQFALRKGAPVNAHAHAVAAAAANLLLGSSPASPQHGAPSLNPPQFASTQQGGIMGSGPNADVSTIHQNISSHNGTNMMQSGTAQNNFLRQAENSGGNSGHTPPAISAHNKNTIVSETLHAAHQLQRKKQESVAYTMPQVDISGGSDLSNGFVGDNHHRVHSAIAKVGSSNHHDVLARIFSDEEESYENEWVESHAHDDDSLGIMDQSEIFGIPAGSNNNGGDLTSPTMGVVRLGGNESRSGNKSGANHSPDGSDAANGLDPAVLQPLISLSGLTSKVTVCGFDGSGELFATGGLDRSLVIWDARPAAVGANFIKLSVTDAHAAALTTVRFMSLDLVVGPDAETLEFVPTLLATASYDQKVRIWDLTKVRQLLDKPPTTPTAKSMSDEPVITFTGQRAGVFSIDFCPIGVAKDAGKPGRKIVLYCGSIDAEGYVKIWEVWSGDVIRSIKLPALLKSSSYVNNPVRFRPVKANQECTSVCIAAAYHSSLHIMEIGFSADTGLMSEDDSFKLSTLPTAHVKNIFCLDWSVDGQWLVTASENLVVLWEVSSTGSGSIVLKDVAKVAAQSGTITCCIFLQPPARTARNTCLPVSQQTRGSKTSLAGTRPPRVVFGEYQQIHIWDPAHGKDGNGGVGTPSYSYSYGSSCSFPSLPSPSALGASVGGHIVSFNTQSGMVGSLACGRISDPLFSSDGLTHAAYSSNTDTTPPATTLSSSSRDFLVLGSTSGTKEEVRLWSVNVDLYA
ncbi:hypothetical protein SeLEV6574_g01703 [Synchytrium endobioticum]|uniref:LisH domain-containing protein n=1 Tax=Synchytrium endobioticum TaxID=286115 RepID=A0A507DDS8_9FUNG|nr:hypothetical protein SeLEV6574_g01703 [Synchytrium endobioticum]